MLQMIMVKEKFQEFYYKHKHYDYFTKTKHNEIMCWSEMPRLLCIIASSSCSGNKNIYEGRTTLVARIGKEWFLNALFQPSTSPFTHDASRL